MNSLEALEKEIADLRRQLKARLAARKALQRLDPKLEEKRGPYTGKRVINAVREVLAEHGSMREDELVRLLIEGGITVGRKRDHHNVRISLETSEKLGTITRDGGVVRLVQQGEQPS